MLKVVGTESTQDEVEGRSLLDEIAREGPPDARGGAGVGGRHVPGGT